MHLESNHSRAVHPIVHFSAFFVSLMQQFAEEMVSLVAEDSESVIAFLGGCKKQLTDQETRRSYPTVTKSAAKQREDQGFRLTTEGGGNT